ncbi:hypothetical protein F5B18DRAFT_545219 [Nemania serpens]|nr:hypothetical protein F5B18DRAFT_545219 [Nemania serpens]
MSSRDSSTGSYTTVVTQDKFRSHKSKDYRGDRIERETTNGRNVVTYNHHARGFDQNPPSPSYNASSSYGKSKKT